MSRPKGQGMVATAAAKLTPVRPIPSGIGTSPSAPITLDPADEAKVRAVQRQVAEHKAALGDLQLRYESSKGHIMTALAGCEQRALAIANEAALAKGIDPAAHAFDWQTLSFTPK